MWVQGVLGLAVDCCLALGARHEFGGSLHSFSEASLPIGFIGVPSWDYLTGS